MKTLSMYWGLLTWGKSKKFTPTQLQEILTELKPGGKILQVSTRGFLMNLLGFKYYNKTFLVYRSGSVCPLRNPTDFPSNKETISVIEALHGAKSVCILTPVDNDCWPVYTLAGVSYGLAKIYHSS